jgi:hypothetical protein
VLNAYHPELSTNACVNGVNFGPSVCGDFDNNGFVNIVVGNNETTESCRRDSYRGGSGNHCAGRFAETTPRPELIGMAGKGTRIDGLCRDG